METPPQVLNKEHEGNRRDGSASVALYNDPASSQNRETIEHNTGRNTKIWPYFFYFLDTGLASFLLGIENEVQMETHPSKGALFESLVVSEILKQRFNKGQTDNLYFFRDNTGNEVDLVCDFGKTVDLIEVKSGQTVASDFFKGIRYFKKLSADIRHSNVVYGGDESYTRENTRVISWRDLPGFEQPIKF